MSRKTRLRADPAIELIVTSFNKESAKELSDLLVTDRLGFKITDPRIFTHQGREYISFRTPSVSKAENICSAYGFVDKAADLAVDAKDHVLKRFELTVCTARGKADQTALMRTTFADSVFVRPAHPDGISEVFARHVGAVRKTLTRARIADVTIHPVNA